LVSGDLEGMVGAASVLRIALQQRVCGLGKDDVVVARAQEHHADRRRILHQLEAKNLRVEFAAGGKIAHPGAEMDGGLRFDHGTSLPDSGYDVAENVQQRVRTQPCLPSRASRISASRSATSTAA